MFGVVCGQNPSAFRSSTRVLCGMILSKAASAWSKFSQVVTERMFSETNKADLFADVQPMVGRASVATRRRRKGVFTTTTLLSYRPFCEITRRACAGQSLE